MSHLFDVIVIGGGASGLAAVSKLIQSGFKNCLLLEAQNRLGGRIWTKKHGNHYLEYGAHWIHGEEGNVVYDFASKNNLVEEDGSLKQTGMGKTICCDVDYSIVNEEIVEEFNKMFGVFSDEAEKDFISYKGSVGQYYSEKFTGINKWGSLGLRLLDWRGRFQCCIDGADSWFDTSAYGHTIYMECPGNPVVNWTSGYETYIKHLMKDIPVSKILLNSPVERIHWNCFDVNLNAPFVTLECKDGSLFRCKHAIVTSSLAVLKEQHEMLFHPQLPLRKVHAIENLGIDVVDKIFLEFPSKWWPDIDGFSFLRRVPLEEISEDNWEHGILGFYEAYKLPRVMCAWITGDAARCMEACSMDVVKKRCMRVLRLRLDKQFDIPEPVWCDRSSWHSNIYCRGSYSFRSLSSEVMKVFPRDLAAPLFARQTPVVCFAGEATHDYFYSTVHGAVESGWREAERIRSFLSCPRKVNSELTRRHFDVVVIGAGMSGLSAALELQRKGINCVILEASNVVGGRILTIHPPSGGFLDLGAQWIHGQHQNDVYEAVISQGLISDRVSVDGQGEFYTDEGERVDSKLVTGVLDALAGFKEDCMEFQSSQSSPSMGQYLDARFEEFLESSQCSLRNRLLKEAVYHWDQKWERIDNACASLKQLSAKRWSDYSTCDGFFNMNPSRGMTAIADTLASKLKSGSIFFDREVVEINYADEVYADQDFHFTAKKGLPPVILKCRNGDVFSCRHVIVTCSLGYLKAHHLNLFRPNLPLQKMSAISNLGYGVIDKIFLEFSAPFWDENFTGFHLLWTNDNIPDLDNPGTSLLKSGKVLDMADFWYRAITSFDPVHGHRSTLCAWIAGPEALYMESLSLRVVEDICVWLLKKFTGKKNIQNPVKTYRSQWGRNDFTLGSYSHRTTADENYDLIGELNDPVLATIITNESFKKFQSESHSNLNSFPVVIFAGEALSRQHYSTLHGAFRNGQDQSGIITSFYEKYHELLLSSALSKSKL